MDISKIPVGINAPYDVNVIIEIPIGGVPVKYELDKESGAMYVDRFLHTAMYYPCNYGFIPHTLSDDGDPTDAAVLGQIPVIPGVVIRSRPVGVLIMEDESGIDDNEPTNIFEDKKDDVNNGCDLFDELHEINQLHDNND